MIDWNSSALWGIIGLIGGALISLIFYIISKKRRILTYKIQTTTLITEEISAIPNLEISYNNTKVSNLIATNIEIKNVGNEVIEGDYFASLLPLKLHIDSGEIFFYCISDSTDKNTNVSLEKNNGEVFIHFEFIKPKSSFHLLIYHTGTLTILGEPKTGKFIDSEELITNKLKILKWLMIIIVVMICFYMIFRFLLPLILIGCILTAFGGLFDNKQ